MDKAKSGPQEGERVEARRGRENFWEKRADSRQMLCVSVLVCVACCPNFCQCECRGFAREKRRGRASKRENDEFLGLGRGKPLSPTACQP